MLHRQNGGMAAGGEIPDNIAYNPPAGGAAPGPQFGGAEPPAGYGSGLTVGGGLTGAAINAAIQAGALAIDSQAPGAGQAAAIAAQIAMQEGQRAIQYAGQVAGIAVSGLQETFLPAGASELASNNWITRIAGGIMGAHPALPNIAGKPSTEPFHQQPLSADQAAQLTPEQVAAAAPPLPPPGEHTGTGAAPGPTQTINLTYNNNGATEDRAGADITHHLSNMNTVPGLP
jgi:hypothetical protein